jgi:ribosomal protein S18 acetylase RimI-like enzyme
MSKNLKLVPLEEKHFSRVIKLGNEVHGPGYLTQELITNIAKKGHKDGINCSFVMLDTSKQYEEQQVEGSQIDENEVEVNQHECKLAGFRLTYAPTVWAIDEWCTPSLWQCPEEQVCYFKCSTVDSAYRGHGIARKMLNASIEATKQQGATAGVCHTWMQSPGNLAYLYFTKCGGEQLKLHSNRWYEDSVAGYQCVVCGVEKYCYCEAAEMILKFDIESDSL